MDLNTLIYLTAGGPGSGCHGDSCGRKASLGPKALGLHRGEGHGEFKKIHHELTKRGWTGFDRLGGKIYTHPQYPYETIHVKGGDKGEWRHWDHRYTHDKGVGRKALVDHLDHHESIKKTAYADSIVNRLRRAQYTRPMLTIAEKLGNSDVWGRLMDLSDITDQTHVFANDDQISR